MCICPVCISTENSFYVIYFRRYSISIWRLFNQKPPRVSPAFASYLGGHQSNQTNVSRSGDAEASAGARAAPDAVPLAMARRWHSPHQPFVPLSGALWTSVFGCFVRLWLFCDVINRLNVSHTAGWMCNAHSVCCSSASPRSAYHVHFESFPVGPKSLNYQRQSCGLFLKEISRANTKRPIPTSVLHCRWA